MRSADAWRLAAESHIGLATLLPKPNYVESYPTKLFEYMSIGLPVVASNFPLYREIVEAAGCGICVDPESPEEIAAAIAAILEDPRMAAEMGTRGQEAALQRFRWDIEAKKLGNFYARVLTQHVGRV
jgi:glycosyltransferase involved in cell wall biosynthesis